MAEDDREPQERSGGLPQRVPGVHGRTPGQIRRGYLPMPEPDPAPDAEAIAQPDTPRPGIGEQLPRRAPGASDIHIPPSPTAMASSAAKLLRAAAASNRAALTEAAAEELATLTQRRVVPLHQPSTAAAQAPAPPATVPPATAAPPATVPTATAVPPDNAAPPATAVPHAAAVPRAVISPAAPPARVRPEVSRRRSARRWQLTGLLLAIAVVASAVAIMMAIRHSPAPATGATAPGAGSQRISAESVIRAKAAVWVASEVGHNIQIACDSATCSDLAQHGFPPGSLNVLQPTAPDPYGSLLVIATAGIRSQFGRKLAAVYAPEVIASFGTGTDRIDVRLVAANGPAAFQRESRKDLQERQSSGAELLRNPRIAASAAGRAQMAAGQVDLRLLTTLAFMAGQEPLDIVDFGSIAPGASPGVPLRFADLAGHDPAARMTAGAYLHVLVSLVHAQEPPYVPLSVRPVRLTTGQTVLRIEFAAPSPLGLLSS
jgi:hypothetical protein